MAFFAAASLSPRQATLAQEVELPSLELRAAVRHLEEFELQVERERGEPFELSYDAREAMRRIADLKERFPDDPEIAALVERTRQALLASRGETFEITPAMVAYRENEQKIIAAVTEFGEAGWQDMLAELAAEDGAILEAFPAPDSAVVSADEMIGKRVVIDDFRYPDNQFMESGREFVFSGSEERGYYFINLSTRAWQTTYGAVRRFRSGVSDDLPQPWTLVGRITGIDLVVPQAGLEKTIPAFYGWVVEPEAIYVPGRVVALAAGPDDDRGRFIGEDRVEGLKSEFYTVTEIPADADAFEVVRLFAIAIKERNWDLYIEAIHESWTNTKSSGRLRYYWDINQRRYSELYVHVEPVEVLHDIVIQGERIDALQDVFLTEDDKAEIMASAEPLIEQVMLRVVRYNEYGKQEPPDSWVQLRRQEGGRWFIYTPQPL